MSHKILVSFLIHLNWTKPKFNSNWILFRSSSHFIRFHYWDSNLSIYFFLGFSASTGNYQVDRLTCTLAHPSRASYVTVLWFMLLRYGNVKVIECRTCMCLSSLRLSSFTFQRNYHNQFCQQKHVDDEPKNHHQSPCGSKSITDASAPNSDAVKSMQFDHSFRN